MPSSVEVVITQDAEGNWLVDVPELPGCHTYGATLDEARSQARDAVALWLETDEVELTEVVNTSA